MADKLIGTHLLVKTHKADVALTANKFVKLVTATGAQPHCTLAGAGEAGVGVSRDAFASGEYADIVKMGEAYVLTGENVAAGQPVRSMANGFAGVAGSGDYIMGQAQTDANSGEGVLVLLSLGGVV